MCTVWKLHNQLTDLGDLKLRVALPCDEAFLLHLFTACRPHLAQIPMSVEYIEALIFQQFQLQRSYYAKIFAGYVNHLLLLNQEPIGALKLFKYAEEGSVRIVDIAILPTQQGRGYGRTLLRSLQAVARKNEWRLRLSVDRQNWGAKKLYGALGFRFENASATHEEMAWTSAVCVD